MGDVLAQTDALIESLGPLSPLGDVFAATARQLARNIDYPATNEKGEASGVSAPANALRGCLADLVAKGCVHDDDGDSSGWADIASIAGATPIRDTAPGGTGNARRRGNGGRPKAG